MNLCVDSETNTLIRINIFKLFKLNIYIRGLFVIIILVG